MIAHSHTAHQTTWVNMGWFNPRGNKSSALCLPQRSEHGNSDRFQSASHHSACLLAFALVRSLTYVIPPAVFVVGAMFKFSLQIATIVVWAIMIPCYAPTLRLYTRRPLEALLLPIAALMYTLMTIDLAQRWRHKNPTWKGRANQTGGRRKL